MELTEISAEPTRIAVRLSDHDAIIRRIFKLDHLLETIRTMQMGLVQPVCWDDPREDPTALCALDGSNLIPPKPQQPLSKYLAPVWAQCWSLSQSTDTLWRAYSQVLMDSQTGENTSKGAEGVAVTTSVRKLLSAADRWNAECPNHHVVVGRVEYVEDEEIGQRIANTCNGKHGPEFYSTVEGRADSLLWKRTFFSMESEVRLLMISCSLDHKNATENLLNLSIDPNILFTSVSFDPRLPARLVRERERELRVMGYRGAIVEDKNYRKVFYQIGMTRDWSAPQS